MRRKKFMKSMAFILVLLMMASISVTGVFAAPAEGARLTIIHINDTHGRTQAEPYISALAKDLTAKGENVLILDAGDRLHGQTVTNLSKGEAVAEIMNEVGYSAMVPGNHDFNFGVERLTELSGMMNFPLLAANVKDSSGNNLFDSYKIFPMNGMRVGVFGIATPETIAKSDPRIVEGLVFEDPAETAALMVSELQNQGCDIIIALAHLGDVNLSLSANKSDAIAVPGVDIIIDGHSHTLLENGRTSGNTLIAQTGEYGGNIGIVEVTVSGGVITKTAKVIAVPEGAEESGLVPDQAILAKIAEEEAEIEPITSVVVGHTPVLLRGEKAEVRTGETNLANLITDSMKYTTGADMAFLTGGNIRASIEPGDITMGHVLTTLPYSNLIVTVELSGADIFDALEHGVSLYPESSGQFIQVSGIKFEFDPDAEPMHRVTKATLADGETLDRNKIYTVATIEFLAAGGDGYSMFSKGTNMVYYQGDAEAFVEYLATNPQINDGPENRMTLKTNASENEDEKKTPEENGKKDKTDTTIKDEDKTNVPSPKTGEEDTVHPYVAVIFIVFGFITFGTILVIKANKRKRIICTE